MLANIFSQVHYLPIMFNETACFKKCKQLFEYQNLQLLRYICGLYYKHVTIVNYASSSVNKLRASLNDNARVVIYDCHMFIVQATGGKSYNLYLYYVRFFKHQCYLDICGSLRQLFALMSNMHCSIENTYL